ncbi:hypothetical protein [Rhizobium terrae]|uniref:hypothetical protein n=1 Tax=Rhizobium terrae TaxID=2171756 RepID=UPI000E3CB74D|nr:hypothetical protein [Rhizobium terrae]
MALSKAEWKRREEEEDAELYLFPWLTWGEFRRWPLRRQQELRQKFTQQGATVVGFWKDCALGKCRRAKRCVGFLSEAQYKAGFNPAFPPCARGEEPRRAKIMDEGIEKLYPSKPGPKYAGRASDGGEAY